MKVGKPDSRGAKETVFLYIPVPIGSDSLTVAWGITLPIPNKFQLNLKIFSTIRNQIQFLLSIINQFKFQ